MANGLLNKVPLSQMQPQPVGTLTMPQQAAPQPMPQVDPQAAPIQIDPNQVTQYMQQQQQAPTQQQLSIRDLPEEVRPVTMKVTRKGLEPQYNVNTTSGLAYYLRSQGMGNEEVAKNLGFSSPQELDKGIQDEFQKLKEQGERGGDLLSVAEAKALGVPFGTTKKEATKLGVTPGKEEEGGGGNLVSAIMQEPRLYNDLTPAEKSEIIPSLQKQGFKFPRKLTGTEQVAQQNAESGVFAAQNLRSTIFDENGDLKETALLAAKTGAGEVAANQKEVVDAISRLRTGAALTKEEEKFYKDQLPGLLDSDEAAKKKLDQLSVFLTGIAGQDVTLSDPKTGQTETIGDMFEQKNRLKARDLLTKGYEVSTSPQSVAGGQQGQPSEEQLFAEYQEYLKSQQ